MKLRFLDANFRRDVEPNGSAQSSDKLEGAAGVMFQCPKCAQTCEAGTDGERDFFRGCHYVICWFVGKVPDGLNPKPGRWTPSGTGLDDLTFVPGNPPRAVSVLITTGCGWHGFIRDGEATLS